jgi:hypothetical protein
MADHTPIQRLRAPKLLWETYGAVCRRALSRNRSQDLIAHMRRTIQRHGTAEEKQRLAEADTEIAARLDRKHAGRPPKST